MTVTSGNGKSSLHKQNVSVCFFSEQKCKVILFQTTFEVLVLQSKFFHVCGTLYLIFIFDNLNKNVTSLILDIFLYHYQKHLIMK
jgi:hypothetical protein